MYSVKLVGEEKYVPKTPYIEEEQGDNWLTNKSERINWYKKKGNAKNMKKLAEDIMPNKKFELKEEI